MSLVGALVVVLAVVAMIVVQFGNDRPAAPTATVERVREVGDAFHVDVTVTNEGDATAAAVQVSSELTIDGQTITGDQTIDFLSGGEDHQLSFVFQQDPAEGELDVVVTGFALP